MYTNRIVHSEVIDLLIHYDYSHHYVGFIITLLYGFHSRHCAKYLTIIIKTIAIQLLYNKSNLRVFENNLET